MTKNDLIKLSTEKFGDIYDFSQEHRESIEDNDFITVRCKKHGLFFETLYHFINSPVKCFECYKEGVWGRKE